MTGAASCALVLAEPDLGSAIAIALMVGAMLIVVGVPGRLLRGIIGVGLALGGVAIWLEPYRRERLLAFLDPVGPTPADGAYQVRAGHHRLRLRRADGVGLGEAIQKVYYLPEAHTDMIFAIIGEELGLVGALFVLVGFAAFAWAGFTIALRAATASGSSSPPARPRWSRGQASSTSAPSRASCR